MSDRSKKNIFSGLSLCKIHLADGVVPEWIPLVPAGAKIESNDGRKFSNSNPQAIVDAFNKGSRDIPLDINHSSQIKALRGEESPAAGWIVSMEVRDGAVWGRVEWNERGLSAVASKEYKYISPALIFEKIKKTVTEIVSAALVNNPALDMPAIAHSETQQDNEPSNKEKIMDKELLEMLGLDENATEDQISEAVKNHKMLMDEANKKADEANKKAEDQAKTIETQEAALASAKGDSRDLDKFVPRSDFDALLARSDKLDSSIKEDKATAHKEKVELEISLAMKSGKIVPANKDFYVETCSTKEGLEKFQEFVKIAPVVGAPSILEGKDRPKPSEIALTASDKEVAIASGTPFKEFLEFKKELTKLAN